MKSESTKSIATVAVVAAVSWGCTTGEINEPIGEGVPAEPAMLALEAYRGDAQYLLRYRRGEDTYYVAGDLEEVSVEAEIYDEWTEGVEVDPVAQQTSRQLPAYIAEPDKTNFKHYSAPIEH